MGARDGWIIDGTLSIFERVFGVGLCLLQISVQVWMLSSLDGRMGRLDCLEEDIYGCSRVHGIWSSRSQGTSSAFGYRRLYSLYASISVDWVFNVCNVNVTIKKSSTQCVTP